MLNFETSFLWHRPIGTPFKFADGRLEIEPGKLSEKQTRVLIGGPDDYKIDRYDPLNEAMDLYRLFALIEDSEESIISFANTYGWLGSAQPIQQPTKLESVSPLIWAETQHTWNKEVTNLLMTLDLWESVRPRTNDNTLDTKLSWSKNNNTSCVLHEYEQPQGTKVKGSRIVYRSDQHSLDESSVDYQDNIRIAHRAVQKDINAQLNKHTSAAFIPSLTQKNESTPNLSLQPKNLLGCIWLQLAFEVSGLTIYDPCSQCGKAMVEPIKRGKLRKTCSDACRKRLFRSK